MFYDLTNPLDKEKFKTRSVQLYHKGAKVELVEKALRTGRQNRYLHLIIGVVAMDCGVTLEEAKVWYFKRLVNPDIFIIKKQDNRGNEIESIVSSASVNKEQMSVAIDRFKRWAYEQGIYIPEEGDEDLLKQIEIEMCRNRAYLGDWE